MDKGRGGIKEELRNYIPFKPFTYQVVYIPPQELHEQYENTNEESGNERSQVGSENENIDFLHRCGAIMGQK